MVFNNHNNSRSYSLSPESSEEERRVTVNDHLLKYTVSGMKESWVNIQGEAPLLGLPNSIY